MVSGRTYYFVIPEAFKPTGGINVALQMASILREAGYDCRMLHATPSYSYPFFQTDVPVCYLPALRPVLKRESLKQRIKSLLRNPPFPARRPRVADRADLRSQDVIVAPEYLYPEITSTFPGHATVLLVQGMMPLAIARSREALRGADAALKKVAAIVATSQATADAVKLLTGRSCSRITLHVGQHSRGLSRKKKLQIAYMPRKRQAEIGFMLDCLRNAPDLGDVTFVPIDNVGPEGVDEILRESLIYLNFPDLEGFGLPGAEAMLAGCIVVEYHGVGGAEYFNSDTGIVVPESDMVAFARQVRTLVSDYRADPAPLDRMRARASRTIAERYSQAAFENSLLGAWSEIDREVGSAPARK